MVEAACAPVPHQRALEALRAGGMGVGNTSALILAAMTHEGVDRLTSIDLPAMGSMHIEVQTTHTGVSVPAEYRNRWELLKTDATYALPSLLRDLNPSMFVHDSDHSYAHMAFEYSLAAKRLPPGGVILSDDIGANRSFFDVMSGVGAKAFAHRDQLNLGAAVLAY